MTKQKTGLRFFLNLFCLSIAFFALNISAYSIPMKMYVVDETVTTGCLGCGDKMGFETKNVFVSSVGGTFVVRRRTLEKALNALFTHTPVAPYTNVLLLSSGSNPNITPANVTNIGLPSEKTFLIRISSSAQLFTYGGACDEPRVSQQLYQTAKQFLFVKGVIIQYQVGGAWTTLRDYGY